MKLAKAKEIALHRIPDEIFVGHNAISVYISLSDHAASLNASHFKDALGSMQRHSLDAFILSLCKIYEKPDNRYPNYSIPTAIVYLQEDMTGLHNGIQNHIKLEQFIQAQIDSSFSVTSGTDLERIPRMIVTWFAERCPQTPPREGYELDPVLDALKVLRDKRVAHHEDNDLQGLSKTDLDSALSLLAFAQTFVDLVGYGFFGFSMNSIASPETFAPNKSIVWSQMQKLLKILEQGAPLDRRDAPGSQ